MHLEELKLANFKNYTTGEFQFSPDVNCLTGNNGSGKTNILDAIYYLCFCKSHFSSIDKNNIRHGEHYFSIKGRFVEDSQDDEIYCAVQEGRKKVFKRNDKAYDRLLEHIGRYPAVMITPNDVELIREGSAERRKFIDGIIAQYDKDYLIHLTDYKKVLLQRNNLLKHFKMENRFDPLMVEVLDQKMIALGEKIHQSRSAFIDKFQPLFQSYYEQICGHSEEVGLEYKSQLNSDVAYSEQLQKNLQADRYTQRTAVGIHKDDLIFTIHEHALKITGSQGQQKSFLIALKLAQFQFIKEATNKTPILLLDDVFDKIDDRRVGFLMELVSKQAFGQIFITDTHQGRVTALFDAVNIKVHEYQITDGESEKLQV